MGPKCKVRILSPARRRLSGHRKFSKRKNYFRIKELSKSEGTLREHREELMRDGDNKRRGKGKGCEETGEEGDLKVTLS